MEAAVSVVGIYVHDQDVALDFYVNKLGFSVKTDARNGNYRWLTVAPNAKAGFELGLFLPQEPVLDAKTAAEIQVMVAKGAMPPLVLTVADCRASYETFKRNGVEFVGPVTPYETAHGVRPHGVEARFLCFKDPDGTIIEYAQFAGNATDVLVE